MSEAVFCEVESKLSEKFQKKVTVKSSLILGGGCINHASKLETSEGPFFLKWNDHCPQDMFVREAEALTDLRLAADKKIIIPEVICYKDRYLTPGFIVLQFLEEGRSGDDDEKLGKGLAEVHTYHGSFFGYKNDNYCGDTPQQNTPSNNWQEFFRDQRLGNLLKLIEKRRGLSVSDKTTYEKLLERISLLVPPDSASVLIHGDLWSGNYLFTRQGPSLIDPAAYYADREMEFAIITMFGGFSSRFLDAYNHYLPLAPDWRDRNKLYQLYHILNHYYLFGGGYGSQALHIAQSYL